MSEFASSVPGRPVAIGASGVGSPVEASVAAAVRDRCAAIGDDAHLDLGLRHFNVLALASANLPESPDAATVTVQMKRLPGGLARWWASVRPEKGTLKGEAVASIPRAAASVPDGMAAAALVGVNPIHGLYASFAGPIAGGLTASTRLMVITTTSAAALAAASALESVPAADRMSTLILITLVAGAAMLIAGFVGMGRLVGFVSHSVMTGFLTGVAVNIILGQLPSLTGSISKGATGVETAWRTLLNPAAMDGPTLLIGAAALLLLWLLPATGMGRYAALVALIVPSVAVSLFDSFGSVTVVADIGEITRGLPTPAFPQFRLLDLGVIVGALSVAAIVLVQGAGVAEAAPNPKGRRSDTNVDFMAQGWANLASGLFRGIPVGGSVSQTALNLSVGARGRWASIISGLWILAVLVAFSSLAEQVAMPTLAAILIVASIGSIRPAQITAVWQAGLQSQVAIVTTFVATLLLPVSAAVGIGVALSLILSLNREAQDVRLLRLRETAPGRFIEESPPAALESNSITVLNIYGSLFYAGARTLEANLPAVGEAERPVVVLRIRGRTMLGATAFAVISRYAAALDERGGRLYLSGAAPELIRQFRDSGRVRAAGPIRLIEAQPVVGESTRRAIADAEAFLITEDRSTVAEPRAPSPATRLLALVRRVGKR